MVPLVPFFRSIFGVLELRDNHRVLCDNGLVVITPSKTAASQLGKDNLTSPAATDFDVFDDLENDRLRWQRQDVPRFPQNTLSQHRDQDMSERNKPPIQPAVCWLLLRDDDDAILTIGG